MGDGVLYTYLQGGEYEDIAGEWDWSNFTGFFWAGICFCCIIYTYFRVPEPSGRSFAELDLLFERKVPARKFATTKVDVFEEDIHAHVIDEYGRQLHAHDGDKKETEKDRDGGAVHHVEAAA